MKKVLGGFAAIVFVLILSGCGKKNEVDLSDKESFTFADAEIQPVSAKFDDDDNVEVNLKWSFGSDEDSMKKESFASTGILIFAKQKNRNLTAGDLADSGIYTKVYEASEGNIYPSFELNNKKDKIKITLQKEGYTTKSESFYIEMP